MKLFYLIIASIFLESSDCDNAKIIRVVFFDLDITKTNKQLIDQLKTDTVFTNYEK